jgi:outer membrane protein TolC
MHGTQPLRVLQLCHFIAAGILLISVISACQTGNNTISEAMQRRSEATAGFNPRNAYREKPSEKKEADKHSNVEWSGGDITPEQAREIALRDNPDLHAAIARFQAASARIGEAQASYYPTVSLGHSSTRTLFVPASRARFANPVLNQPTLSIPVSQDENVAAVTQFFDLLRRPAFLDDADGSSDTFSEHSTSISFNWTIFDGFAREARVLASRHATNAADSAVANARRLIAQSTERAYFEIQLAHEQLRIARADEEFNREQLEFVQKQKEAEKAIESDVLNFELRYEAAKADVVNANGRIKTGRIVLAELMGMKDAQLPESMSIPQLSAESSSDLSTPETMSWLTLAVQQRPDLQFERSLHKQRGELVRAGQALYLPNISIQGSYGFDHSSNVAYSSDDQSSAVGIELAWQLFTGGLRHSQVARLMADEREQEDRLRAKLLNIQSEVRQALVQVEIAQEQVRLQRKNIERAEKNRKLVQQAYRAGKVGIVRLNESQTDLIRTQANLAMARVQLKLAWTDLNASAGTM